MRPLLETWPAHSVPVAIATELKREERLARASVAGQHRDLSRRDKTRDQPFARCGLFAGQGLGVDDLQRRERRVVSRMPAIPVRADAIGKSEPCAKIRGQVVIWEGNEFHAAFPCGTRITGRRGATRSRRRRPNAADDAFRGAAARRIGAARTGSTMRRPPSPRGATPTAPQRPGARLRGPASAHRASLFRGEARRRTKLLSA